MTRTQISAIATVCFFGSAITNWRFGVASGATEPWLYLWGIVAFGVLVFWFLTIPLFATGAVLLLSGIRKTNAREAIAGTAILCGTWLALGAIFCFGDLSL